MALLVLNQLTKRCASTFPAGEAIRNRFLPLAVLDLVRKKQYYRRWFLQIPLCRIVPLTMMTPDWGNSVAAAACATAIELAKLRPLVRAIAHFPHRACPVRARVIGCPVNIEVAIHHQVVPGLNSL
jgi:hypothetical protein